jgi:RNA polymerase sigma-70 factor (ECF subfamily)
MTFEDLAVPLLSPLYTYARWLTSNAYEAEDLVQETYLKGLRGFASFTPGTNFRAWMYRILRNTFLTSRSGLKAQMSIDDDPDRFEKLPVETTPESLLFARRDLDRLRAAIDSLSLPFREVLLLVDIEEMSYRDVAETLSIPIGTVTSRVMRARKKLREAMR